jgi:thioesterase domain-containing protein
MAASYVAAMRDLQPHGPYLLGGWSLGGVVAFEMAQLLRRQGEQVELLTLIDSRVPMARAGGEEEAEDEASLLASFFVDMSGSSGQYAPEQLSRVFADLRRFEDKEERLEYVLRQASAHQLVPPHTDLSHVRRLVNVFKSNRMALRSYTPCRYEGRVVLFRAQDEPDTMAGDTTLGWGALTERLEVVDVAGDHYDVLTGARVQRLAELLKTYLEGPDTASQSPASD